MVKKQSNDSPEQKKQKAQNQHIKNDNGFGNRHTDGPNRPST